MLENDSTPSDDIYGDLQPPLSTNNVSLGYESDGSLDSSHTSIPSDAWMDEGDLEVLSPEPKNEAVSTPSLIEPTKSDAMLRKAEMDLYDELLSEEAANRSKLVSDPEFKALQDELIEMKTLLSEKDIQVSDLTNQVVNLKKNICSLYKTAKAEIEQKDSWLAEANEKVNRYHSERFFRIDYASQSTQTDPINNTTKTPSVSTDENRPLNARETCLKRKHSPVPPKKIPTKNDQVQKKRKLEECNLIQNEKAVSNNSNLDAINTFDELNIKFNLLPEEIKSSFKEHEQSYISSLNTLKQSLIDCFSRQDQTNSKSVSLSPDPSFKSPTNATSSDAHTFPHNAENLLVSKDTPSPSEKVIQSSIDKNSKDERAKASKESHDDHRRSPSARKPHPKRTAPSHERHVTSDRTTYASSSISSKRDKVHKPDRNSHHYRTREPSVVRTHPSNYYLEHRRRTLYKHQYRDRYYRRPSCSPIGKNASTSLTLYKMRKERALKRQLNLSQQKLDEESNK